MLMGETEMMVQTPEGQMEIISVKGMIYTQNLINGGRDTQTKYNVWTFSGPCF